MFFYFFPFFFSFFFLFSLFLFFPPPFLHKAVHARSPCSADARNSCLGLVKLAPSSSRETRGKPDRSKSDPSLSLSSARWSGGKAPVHDLKAGIVRTLLSSADPIVVLREWSPTGLGGQLFSRRLTDSADVAGVVVDVFSSCRAEGRECEQLCDIARPASPLPLNAPEQARWWPARCQGSLCRSCCWVGGPGQTRPQGNV